jgi:hypothetical protein
MGAFNSQIEANYPTALVDERFGDKVSIVTRRNKPYIVKVVTISN